MEVESAETRGGGRRYKLHDFEGPLDLLLYLIRKNEINIYDIPVAAITEQYLEYIRFAETLDLEDVTEFQSMAAMLLLIKSRTLLPVEMDDDTDYGDPRQELVERLIEYQKFKKLSELMEEKEKEAEWTLERQKLQRNLPFNEADMWEKVDVWSLMRTFAMILKRDKQLDEQIFDLYEEVTTNEKTVLLIELMETRGECYISDLIVHANSVMDVVCAFLAILEAVKVRMIVIFQHRMFGDILIKPHANAATQNGDNN